MEKQEFRTFSEDIQPMLEDKALDRRTYTICRRTDKGLDVYIHYSPDAEATFPAQLLKLLRPGEMRRHETIDRRLIMTGTSSAAAVALLCSGGLLKQTCAVCGMVSDGQHLDYHGPRCPTCDQFLKHGKQLKTSP